ncbi:hypothetical protein GCM10020000_68060 [Streptomyces olivoverticillatus]
MLRGGIVEVGGRPPGRVHVVNPWLAMACGADPAERSRTVRGAHAAFVSGGGVRPGVRDVVADSWRRSAAALPGAEFTAPVELEGGELERYRRAHPMARAMPLFRELLGSIADDGAHLLAVCDAAGRLLWVEGHAGLRRRAERMNFVAGARWDERHAGTNAPGTALALDHAVQIFATEHYNRLVQHWTCAAAPPCTTCTPAGCWVRWTSPAATTSRGRTASRWSRRPRGRPRRTWRRPVPGRAGCCRRSAGTRRCWWWTGGDYGWGGGTARSSSCCPAAPKG